LRLKGARSGRCSFVVGVARQLLDLVAAPKTTTLEIESHSSIE
jgi:hypothetical protein